ncbi:hypothetical protein BDR22DRAFT_970260 [Usnea florida]
MSTPQWRLCVPILLSCKSNTLSRSKSHLLHSHLPYYRHTTHNLTPLAIVCVALIKMLHRYLEDQKDDLRIRYDERSLADKATWAKAPQRAKRSKAFLAFPRRLLSKSVDKAVAISGSFLPTKVVLRPTARGDESPLLRFKSMSSYSESLTTQQTIEIEQDSMQEDDLSASFTPGNDVRENVDDQLRILKGTLETCGRTLKDLSEEALRWSRVTNHAKLYFENIARDVEAELARLDLWATNEDEAQDLRVGKSSSNETLKDAVGPLEGILSSAENIEKLMDILGSLASQDSVEKTGCETNSVNLLPDQGSVEKTGEELETSRSLAGQEKVADKLTKFVLRLHILSSRIEREIKCISLHVSFLERISDEVHEPQATQDQQEPPLAPRQDSPLIRSQAREARAEARESQAEMDQGVPRRQMPIARGVCTSWYESREEEKDEAEENEDGDSNYEDDDDDDDDDARFNHWKMYGYMRTPKTFYSWQERVPPHSRDPICIDAKNP